MKLIIFLVLGVLMSGSLGAQNFWKKADETELSLRNTNIREIIPNNYKTFSLEMGRMNNYLSTTPLEFSEDFLLKSKTMFLPMPDGSIEEFSVWQSPLMEDELASKYPSIKTYKAHQKNNPSITARFSTGPYGFHAAIRNGNQMIYIDPYSIGDLEYYNVYFTDEHEDAQLKDKIMCGTDEAMFAHKDGPKWGTRNLPPDGKMELRKYRLALACTGEWGALRGTKEKALSDMVTFVERANVIFEAELAARLVFVNNNDVLISIDGSTDDYDNPEAGLSILGQNTGIINQKIGYSNYEVGHVFSICYDVGGVAGGNICTPAKGAGVTCHNGLQISNGIVLVFNHEVGHQMTAAHTFNNCPGQEGQASSFGYEPGSGSTIMAYPGACGASNLGAPRDNYFHVITLEQILSYTNSVGAEAYNCAEKVDINNFVPVIDMPYQNGFFIPKSTPFFLKASATDENGDNMTYNWEQFDAQGSSPLGEPTGNAPIFRSLRPAANSARYFPNVSRILNRDFTNVQEFMPTYGRDLTFRFVVRDNNPLGSAATWEEVKFKVAAGDVGPFELTFPVNEQKMVVGKKLNVVWEVANTDKAPVNCKYVDIYVALSNSLDFDSDNLIKVAEAVPNDGNETIIVPNTPTTSARIVVKASDNIFFTTGVRNSRIDLPVTPSFIVNVNEPNRSVCLPDNVNFEFTSEGFAGLSDDISFEVLSGLPEGAIASFTKSSIAPGESTSLSLDLSDVKGTSEYDVIVRSIVPGIDTIDRILRLFLTSTDLNDVALVSPANGISGVGPTQKYQWNVKDDAKIYEQEVATSPSFDADKMVVSKTTTDTFFTSNTFLDKATIYFWRVRSSNDCRIGEWSEISAFTTESLDCAITKSGSLSINISQSGTPKVETDLYFNADGTISDVNIKNIRATHQWASDLAAFLKSPSGKEVMLWSRKCSNANGVNIGLDDQSNEFFQCPISTGKIYRPESPLSAFNGEDMRGNWTLRLEDRVPGNGGRLLNFDLELCANITLNPPVLTKNETLKIRPKESKEVNRDLLLADDPDNSPDELTFIIVSVPSFGILTVNGMPVSAGNTFTQTDINQSKIQYLHTAENEQNDYFSFVVTDGKGGWVNITKFIIDVDASLPSSLSGQDMKNRFIIYPNPADEMIIVKSVDNVQISKCTIADMTGRILIALDLHDSTLDINVSALSSGVYTMSLHTDNNIISKKVIKR